MICESARLVLRRAEPGDARFLVRLLNQHSWIRGIGDRNVRTIADAERYIEARLLEPFRALGYGMSVVVLKATGEAIGLCGLVKRDTLPHPDLGFALLDDYSGQGYAQEAAEAVMAHSRVVLKIPQLLAITSPTNDRSGKLLLRLGFVLERRGSLTPGGEELNIYASNPAP